MLVHSHNRTQIWKNQGLSVSHHKRRLKETMVENRRSVSLCEIFLTVKLKHFRIEIFLRALEQSRCDLGRLDLFPFLLPALKVLILLPLCHFTNQS